MMLLFMIGFVVSLCSAWRCIDYLLVVLQLLEARRSVLRDGEADLFKSATVALMSDEEDGVVDGVAGWIVRTPPSHSRELSELCAVLQSRLEANPKYMESCHRRLKEGKISLVVANVTFDH